MLIPERTYSYEATKQLSDAFEKKLLGKIKYETICYKDDDFPTYVTYGKIKSGKLVTRGNGKGAGLQSQLSSIFEAIEHSFYESYFLKYILKWNGVVNKFLDDVLVSMDCLFKDTPSYENIKNIKEKVKIPVIKFQYFGAKKELFIPLYMYGPAYPTPSVNAAEASFIQSVYFSSDYQLKACLYPGDQLSHYNNFRDAIKYSSSAGGAAGIDFDETLLHALNEIIERDTTSEYLLRAIIHNDYRTYSLIDNDSLDTENKQIVAYLEKSYGLHIAVIDISGIIGIPTIMVIDKDNTYGKETLFTGYGTSLSIEYAIQRALLEYKQTIDLVLYDKTLPDIDTYKDFLESNNVNEFFLKLYYFDYKEMLSKLALRTLPELKTKYCFRIDSISGMLNTITERLKENQFQIIYNDVQYPVEGGTIHYLKAMIPQMCDITDQAPLRLPTKRKIEDVLREINK